MTGTGTTLCLFVCLFYHSLYVAKERWESWFQAEKQLSIAYSGFPRDETGWSMRFLNRIRICLCNNKLGKIPCYTLYSIRLKIRNAVMFCFLFSELNWAYSEVSVLTEWWSWSQNWNRYFVVSLLNCKIQMASFTFMSKFVQISRHRVPYQSIHSVGQYNLSLTQWVYHEEQTKWT